MMLLRKMYIMLGSTNITDSTTNASFNPKIKEAKGEIPRVTNLATNTSPNAKINEVKACVRYFLSNFYFFIKRWAFKNYGKCFFISSKKLFSFLRYLNFCNFFSSFPHFPDSKGQMEVE